MRLRTILVAFITACLFSALCVTNALAIPPLPSSFYGHVKFNGGNVPDGTLVRAIIGGQAFAEGRTQLYQGESVYTVDVRGDDTSTPARDGGVEGDTVQFEVGGVLAGQTGIWHTGTNIEVDLAISGTGALGTPPPTIPPVPTQTPIAAVQSAAHLQVTPQSTASASGQSVDSSGVSGLVIVALAVIVIIGMVWYLRRRR